MKVGFEKNLHLILSEPWERREKNHRSHWRPILCKLDFLLGCASRLTISFISDFYFLLLLALLLFIQLNFSSSSSHLPLFSSLLGCAALLQLDQQMSTFYAALHRTVRLKSAFASSCYAHVRPMYAIFTYSIFSSIYNLHTSARRRRRRKRRLRWRKKCKIHMLSSTSSCGRVRALCTQLKLK